MASNHERAGFGPLDGESGGTLVPRAESEPQNVAKCRDLSQASGEEKRKTKPNNQLTPRQRAALKWLIEGATVSAVADQLGVERRTVGRWKKHPRFVAEAERLCAPQSAIAPVERVRVFRVTPRSKCRKATQEIWDELVGKGPRKYVWKGVEYTSMDDYIAAVSGTSSKRGASRSI